MSEEKDPTRKDPEARPVSGVWLLYGVYLILLGWLAFGSHAPDVEDLLTSFGVRQVYEERTYGGESHVVAGRARMPGSRLARPIVWYAPNYGGVLLYAVGGGLVAYYVNDRQRRRSGGEENAPVPQRGEETNTNE